MTQRDKWSVMADKKIVKDYLVRQMDKEPEATTFELYGRFWAAIYGARFEGCPEIPLKVRTAFLRLTPEDVKDTGSWLDIPF